MFWFDSPYYHILYKNRNDEEALLFLENIVQYLNPKSGSKFLDVACGRGRYAMLLNKMGYDVTGIDTSKSSIDMASRYSNDSLHFKVHDMRKTVDLNYFDYVVNFFTSFGFFETFEEHQHALQAIASNLKTKGKLILDFLNVDKTIKHLVPHETKEVENIKFCINRKIENDFIIKEISFEKEDKSFYFTEKLKILTQKTFLKLFYATNLHVESIFGNYKLDTYDKDSSDRMIFIVTKC